MDRIISKLKGLLKKKPVSSSREFQTSNLINYDHPEIVIHISDDVIPDIDVENILEGFENQVRQGVKFEEGQRLQLGMMLNEFQALEDGRLILTEPDMISFPISFIQSMNATFRYLRQQKDTVESVNAEMTFPEITQAISVYQNYIQSQELILQRSEPNGSFSGWTVASSEDFDKSKYSLVSIYQVALDRPDLLKFLALPVGATVYSHGQRDITIYIDDDNIEFEEGSYLDLLTQS